MQRRSKVELFEQIRREYEFGGSSIRATAQKFGVHRRLVRQALSNAVPPERKCSLRSRPKLEMVRDFINRVLDEDRRAPRKQRHTAHRIYVRLGEELSECQISERTVRDYVRQRKVELGLLNRDIAVVQTYDWGVEAQVDWSESVTELDGQRQKVQVFSMRSMASGGAFHYAYPRPTQQAFLEAHELAFRYFGGVFRRLRYDNLKAAVKKILRGARRVECERFVAFRSHWQFEASFCNPAKGNEKGGVEGEVGYFRRNHFVPVPVFADFAQLNEWLMAECRRDESRRIGAREQSVGEGMVIERASLLPLQAEGFALAEESFCRVDGKGCVQAGTNFYSTPLRTGSQVRARLLPQTLEVWHDGRCVARHERSYNRRQMVLDLEHYLDVLAHKPGALAGSSALARWRAEGRWTSAYDELWQRLQLRHGSPAGTRLMIELLKDGRQHGYEQLRRAIEQALATGATDAAAVRYLLLAPGLESESAPPLPAIEGTHSEHYERPLPLLASYDQLLASSAPQMNVEVRP